MSSPVHFDADSLKLLKDVMEEEFDELIGLFVADSEERLPVMKAALQQQLAGELMSQAHSFKGASGNVCAVTLSEYNRQLEDHLRSASETSQYDWPLLTRLLDEVETEYLAVRRVIDDGL
ncbi:Hpt domain-containing protein [Oceanobacter mangrovi]|uniref:Hpt domain-containing protein n=1 Tax=Oceanobacter mangrovi TaxID=2862510 RepID=UPI001C8EF718|nr:Hpt domain-containing protein [Oceanobacter mangrovi]